MIELTVLGTGTVAPSNRRTSPAHWVTTGSVRLLLDCGAGTLHRAAMFRIPWHTVTHVALSHFHVDHLGELPALLLALRWGAEPAREQHLDVVGPVGLRDRMHHLAGAFGDWVVHPDFPLEIHEIHPGEEYRLGPDAVLETCETPHSEESIAYAVRDSEARMVYTGDTGPSATLARWASGCDLLLAECSLPEDRAIATHLTPGQVGELARDASARRLVLTHFYPPVEAVDPEGQVREAYTGEVTMAEDGDRFTVGPRDDA